ncbi:AAA family ATPase, partial [Pseudomonas sp.]
MTQVPYDLKKINVFVGQNSSGKSSFIRTLPLLKQSAQVKTLSEILWYGPLVDFGSFDEALSRNSKNKKIEFIFEIEINSRSIMRASRFRFRIPEETIHAELNISIYPERATPNSPLITEYAIDIFETKIKIKINEKLKILKFTVNGEDFTNI